MRRWECVYVCVCYSSPVKKTTLWLAESSLLRSYQQKAKQQGAIPHQTKHKTPQEEEQEDTILQIKSQSQAAQHFSYTSWGFYVLTETNPSLEGQENIQPIDPSSLCPSFYQANWSWTVIVRQTYAYKSKGFMSGLTWHDNNTNEPDYTFKLALLQGSIQSTNRHSE